MPDSGGICVATDPPRTRSSSKGRPTSRSATPEPLLSDSPARGITAPRQERSRLAAERVLTATRDLLAERSFASVTINDICIAADVSPSTIYARFRTKRAILEAMLDQYRLDIDDLHDQLVERFLEADELRHGIAAMVWGWYEFLVLQDTTRRALMSDPGTRRHTEGLATDALETMATVLPERFPHLDRRAVRGLFVALRTAGAYVEQTIQTLRQSGGREIAWPPPAEVADDVEHLVDMVTVYAASVFTADA